MAGQQNFPVHSSAVNGVLAVITFKTNGSSAIDSTVTRGKRVGTATYVSSGKYKIALDRKYPTLLGAVATLMSDGTTNDFTLQVDVSEYGSGNLYVLAKVGGTLTDITSATNNYVSLWMMFESSGIPT